ncbi:MAG: DnaJ domain-containing protein [Desulfobacter sp.]|nr:MAG: DnaJ domain-containing protein [Desulfobacter sp.]
MDKKQAFQILGIGPGTTQKEAKIAFRALAKTCHPDRYRFTNSFPGEIAAQDRMKEINLAFDFILPLLPMTPANEVPKNEPKDEPKIKTENRPGPGFFSSIKKKFKPGSRPRQAFKSRPDQKKSSGPRPKARPVEKTGFASVLNALEPGIKPALLNGSGLRSCTQPYENYYRYMAFKKKIKDAKKKSRTMGGDSVGKISPVQRIKPIGHD